MTRPPRRRLEAHRLYWVLLLVAQTGRAQLDRRRDHSATTTAGAAAPGIAVDTWLRVPGDGAARRRLAADGSTGVDGGSPHPPPPAGQWAPPLTPADLPQFSPPPRSPLAPRATSTIAITWAKSPLLFSALRVVSGTIVRFEWPPADGHSRDLRLCPTQHAFDTCATEECELLVPAQESGDYLFHTDLVGGEPVTGAFIRPLCHHAHR
jgi:hypothetical protein